MKLGPLKAYLPKLSQRRALAAARDLPPEVVPPLVPADGKRLPAMAAVVMGIAGERYGDLVDMIVAQQRALGLRPVFFTDQIDFAPLRAHRLGFDYLPSARAQAHFDPSLNWRLYSRRRYLLFLQKFRPISVVGFGPVVEERIGPLALSDQEREFSL